MIRYQWILSVPLIAEMFIIILIAYQSLQYDNFHINQNFELFEI